MRYLSSVGLSLSVVFGCLLLALIAEVYYLLWWKKRINNRDIEEDCNIPIRDQFFYLPCFKKTQSLSTTALNPQEPRAESQAQLFPNKDFWVKRFGEEDSVDDELLTLSGPPRFLFTINEETKEDLESEDAKSRSRSLSDILLTIETPFLTPLASPSCFTPPLTPMNPSDKHNRFSPLFKSATDAEFNRISSSPPPKFKFLRDAEDKLHRRVLIQESEIGSVQNDEQKLPFKSSIGSKKKETELNYRSNLSQYPSSSSQVLPLEASPPIFTPFFKQPNSN